MNSLSDPISNDKRATDMSVEQWRDYRYRCPVEATLDVIGGRWKGAIVVHLAAGPQRFSELRRLFGGVSQRSLTTQLRELERDDVLRREVFAQVPARVEYSLSERGQTLVPILRAMSEWGGALTGPTPCLDAE